MKKNPKFDDIRPYYEEEIPAAMQRISDSDVFPLLASFVYPTDNIEDVRERIRSFKTTREFQHDTNRPFVDGTAMMAHLQGRPQRGSLSRDVVGLISQLVENDLRQQLQDM